MTRAGTIRGRSGIALLITLLTLVLVVAIVLEIFKVGSRSARSAAFSRDSIRASLLADAGLKAAVVALREDAGDNDYDTLDEIWSRQSPPIDLGPGVVVVTIADEERKINLNDLIGTNGIAPVEQKLAVFRKLLENLSLEPSIADAVVDWLDADDSTRSGGAESGYYQSGKTPYKAKNDLFDTLDELRLVRGVTPEAFRKLEPFVAVSAQGARINVNTAPKEVLMSLSAGQDAVNGGAIDAGMADRIVGYRRENPFRKGDESSLKAEMEKASPALGALFRNTRVVDLLDVRSATFRVRSEGDVNGVRRTLDAVGTRAGNAVQWRCRRLE